ncbi:FtsX-like permease family protein [Sporofaciens sp. JLR.KK001]|uniref:ABC transporter permease n=1 Tax=Sporofaciens sp. JLR.KK001 TaxID=3112621 RepID=UPI002FF2F124
MKMTTRVAFDNMKYYKNRNILIGITIILTTMLLFIVPAVGRGMLEIQFAVTDRLYPSWHALYRNVDEETARKLAVHHDISKFGLRSDAGYMNLDKASVVMMYVDEAGMELYKMAPAEGTIPRREDEIVVSPGILKELGQQGDIGDTVTVPYQIFRGGELDLTQQKEFRICGFFEDSEDNYEKRIYTALVSEAFLKNEIPKDEIAYRFLLQIGDEDKPTTDEIEDRIKNAAEQFGIPESEININTDYLMANYVDPVMVPAIVLIMLIVMLAGAITIYSIYYVSMNQRIREFGRMKAIGATKRQIRQIVLREGLCIAAFAVPAGLLIGTFVSREVIEWLLKFTDSEAMEAFAETAREVLADGEVNLCCWWIYLLAAAVTVCTVYFSLARPMHMAAKVSEVEAMRMQTAGKNRRSRRKGYEFLSIGRLTLRNLTENKKKSAVTIVSMAATGVFLMVVATVLSCADPRESADNSLVGQYEILPDIEEYNKEHPERKWSEIQKDNPLNDTLRQQIEALPGVERVDVFSSLRVDGDVFSEEEGNSLNGIPQEYAKELEKGVTEGKVTYEELKTGDKVLIDEAIKYWHPELKVGDKLNLRIQDGGRTFNKEVEIAAIGDYRNGLTNFDYLIMAKEAVDRLSEYNSSRYFHVIADKDYDQTLEKKLQDIINASGRMSMRTWKAEYEQWRTALATTRGASYAFLGILAAISVMNLINTMINSVHVRRKELGMMQAIGMSDSQLMKMLQLEGLFYTAGTLAISVGLGSLAGYPVFLYAKKHGMFNISAYHYPAAAAVVVSIVLLALQIALAAGISRSVRKNSLIERIRFSE